MMPSYAVIVTAIYCFALFGSTFVLSNNDDDDTGDTIKDVQLSSGKGAMESKQTLKFVYCYSCGYQKTFVHYSGILTEKYPGLHIIGTYYEPSFTHLFVAKLLGIIKTIIIIAVASGLNFFDYIGQLQPNLWQWCTTNKTYVCLVVFFGFNIFEGILISTGAFELFFNDIPVWSKLETGRIPHPAELFQIIDNYLLFDNPYPS